MPLHPPSLGFLGFCFFNSHGNYPQLLLCVFFIYFVGVPSFFFYDVGDEQCL